MQFINIFIPVQMTVILLICCITAPIFFELKPFCREFCYIGIRVFVYLFKIIRYEKEINFCCQLYNYQHYHLIHVRKAARFVSKIPIIQAELFYQQEAKRNIAMQHCSGLKPHPMLLLEALLQNGFAANQYLTPIIVTSSI